MTANLIRIRRRGETIEALDCQACGACCAYFFKHPDGVLAEPLPPSSPLVLRYETNIKFTWPDGDEEIVHDENHFMKAKAVNGLARCVALEGEPGHSVSCSIYDERPHACRGFEAGGELCLRVRTWAATEGLL
jgi:Fe-S-cluster containining protein